MIYNAGQLDLRNIGSNITINLDDRTLHGTIATVEHYKDRTEVFLQHGEDPIILDPDVPVNVLLPQQANYTLHIRGAVEKLQQTLDAMESHLGHGQGKGKLRVV